LDIFSGAGNFGHVCLFISPFITMSKITSSNFFILLLILILIAVIAAAGKEGYRRYQVDKEISELEDRIKQLEERNSSLSNLLGHFKSEEFLEKEARLKLNLVKEGEKLVIINSDENLSASGQETKQKKQISNIRKWWNWLGFGE